MEEGDGAGDVWIWRRDEGWTKAMEQRGMDLEEG